MEEEKKAGGGRLVSVGFRLTPEVKGLLDQLVQQLSDVLGTRVSQTQAVEVALKEAVAKRQGEACL